MNFIAFDFDGTIADSRFAICEAMERACIRNGVFYIGDEEYSQYIGLPLNEIIWHATKDPLDEEKVEKIGQSYRETFRDVLVKPHRGMPRLLELCHQAGDKVAIASSRNSNSLNMLSAHIGVKDTVDAIVGGDKVLNAKPHGALLWEVATMLGCSPSEVIVVGDTAWDIEMAKNCGAFSIGVTWGSHDEADLIDAGADIICSSARELAAHFNFATV